MKKIATVTVAAMTAATVAIAPAASATTSTAIVDTPETTTVTPINDDAEPTLGFYSGAMGNMFKCGGAIAKIWCRTK